MTPRAEIAAVLDRIAETHGLTIEEITGKRNFRELVEARTEAAHELYQLGLTAREIGKILNRRLWTVYLYLRKPWTP